MEFELTAQNEMVLISSLIGDFLQKLKNNDKDNATAVLLKIKKIKLQKNNEAKEIQKTFIELVSQILKSKTIYYSELAQRLNEKYNFHFPLRGSSLGKKLGNILGSLSIISIIHADVAISVYVVNKQSNKAGEGFKNLLKILNKKLDKKEDEYDERVEKFKVNQLFAILKDDTELIEMLEE
jgi:hypothetical protein